MGSPVFHVNFVAGNAKFVFDGFLFLSGNRNCDFTANKWHGGSP